MGTRTDAPPLVRPNGIIDWTLDHAVQRHVLEVLLYCGGNTRWAAKELGIEFSTLYRWKAKWGWSETASEATERRVTRLRILAGE